MVRLVRRQERFLLAVLALEPGRFVPVERLADLLWQEPPAQARGGVAAMGSHLRSALAPAQPLGVHIRAGRGGDAPEGQPAETEPHPVPAPGGAARAPPV